MAPKWWGDTHNLTVNTKEQHVALRIRLKRHGKKKQPVYRVVVAASTNPRDGESVEILGLYDPRQTPVYLSVKEDRVSYWMGVGAKPTDTVARLLTSKGLLTVATKQSSQQGVKRKDRPQGS